MKTNKHYLRYLKRYLPHYICVIVFSFTFSISNLLKAFFLKIIIDDVLGKKNLELFKILLLLLLTIILFQISVSYIMGYLSTYITQNVGFSLRKSIIEKIEKVKIKYIDDNKSGDIVVMLTEDVNAISNILSNNILGLVISAFTIILTAIYIYFMSPILSFISLIVILILSASSTIFTKATRKNQSEILATNAEHMGIIYMFIRGMRFLRSYTNENKLNQNYMVTSNEIRRLNFKAYLIGYLSGNMNVLLNFIGSIIIFATGVLLAFQDKISVGTLFVIDSLISVLHTSTSNIISLILQFMRASVSFSRLNELFVQPEEKKGNKKIDDSIKTISFNKVSYSYNTSNIVHIYNDLNLYLRAGETYAIVGKSGIGKSTFINLLMKFYPVNSGNIYINNENLDDICLYDLRERIVVTYQEGFIMNASIRDNITFGYDIDDSRFDQLTMMCRINDFVGKLPEKYESIINENGNNFSGGECQRLMIARALLREGDVYVFDESFSQIDASLANEIIEFICKELKNKIVIFITHDMVIAESMDNIISFNEGGKVVSKKGRLCYE